MKQQSENSYDFGCFFSLNGNSLRVQGQSLFEREMVRKAEGSVDISA